jgi:hypothetical protein
MRSPGYGNFKNPIWTKNHLTPPIHRSVTKGYLIARQNKRAKPLTWKPLTVNIKTNVFLCTFIYYIFDYFQVMGQPYFQLFSF